MTTVTISPRMPIDGTGPLDPAAKEWLRIINGQRYLFWQWGPEIKVSRLYHKGSDFVHRINLLWIEVDDPGVGEVGIQDGHPYTTCAECDAKVDISREGMIREHTRRGEGPCFVPCSGAGRAASVAVARWRDSRLTAAETRGAAAAIGWWMRCRGYDQLTGEECSHPVCRAPGRRRCYCVRLHGDTCAHCAR